MLEEEYPRDEEEIGRKIKEFLYKELGQAEEEEGGTFREYIIQLLFDSEEEEEEVAGIIIELLEEAAFDSHVGEGEYIRDFVATLMQDAANIKERKRQKAADAADQLMKSLNAVKVSTDIISDPSLRSLLVETRSNQKKEGSRQEKQERERLLARYGYELDEAVEGKDGETEIVFKSKVEKNTVDPLFSLSQSNSEIVKEKQRLQKLQHQEKHLKEKARNKELLEKQRKEKEQKTKGTQKREKQRS